MLKLRLRLWLQIPVSPYIDAVQRRLGLEVADNYIVQHFQAEDLGIASDILLAAKVIEKGDYALNPRGKLCSKTNIRERLSMRNFIE